MTGGVRPAACGIRKLRRAIAIALYLCALVTACTQDATAIKVSDAWAPATPPNATVGAVYMQIDAHDGDTLLGATAPIAKSVELHQSSHENGTMKMRQLESLPIAPTRATRMEPGGTHFMLIGLSAPLAAGTKVPLTLLFEKAGEISLQVAVMADHEHR